MYICVCHAISDKSVNQALQTGVCSLGDLRRSLGCTSSCGKCTHYLNSLIDQRKSQKLPQEN